MNTIISVGRVIVPQGLQQDIRIRQCELISVVSVKEIYGTE